MKKIKFAITILEKLMGSLNIQIFGTKKCSDTRKAERFFKERRINVHFRDLNEKGISKGELDNILKKINIDDIFDKGGKRYKEKNLDYMTYDIYEILLEDPLLLKTPVVRNGNLSTVGYSPEIWAEWLKNSS